MHERKPITVSVTYAGPFQTSARSTAKRSSEGVYTVTQVVNSIEFTPGQRLSVKDMTEVIARPRIKVIVKSVAILLLATCLSGCHALAGAGRDLQTAAGFCQRAIDSQVIAQDWEAR